MTNILSQLNHSRPVDKIIASDSQQSITVGDLIEQCQHLANELRTHSIKVLALYGDNSVNWLVIDLACQLASVCLIPLATFFSTEQLKHIFESTNIDAIICENPELFNQLFQGTIQKQQKSCIKGYELVSLKSNDKSSALPGNTNKITFTSGSTGNPKGVCLSNEQLIKQAKALSEVVNIKEARHLCLLPLSTLLENVAGIYAPLLSGGEIIMPRLTDIGFEGSSSLNPEKFIQTISQYSPNTIILTPQLLAILVSAANAGWNPPESLQFVAVGGSKVSAKLLKQAHKLGIPAFEGYGLSECASVVSLNTLDQYNHNSCGKPLSHLQVKIIDGEIVIEGNAMLGYMGEPDSWGKNQIYTGDLGSLDNEGFLSILGRKKNVLISSYGRNINPEWVESEILCYPLIAECIVFGDTRPFCVALLSPRNPDVTDREIQQILDSVNQSLPDYARIKKWQRLDKSISSQQKLITENGRPKRHSIYTHYQQQIHTLYEDHSRAEIL